MVAARSAALLTASPFGTALGGRLTTALGPRATLGGSGLANVMLGTVACVLLLAGAGAHRNDQESRSTDHRAAVRFESDERTGVLRTHDRRR
jgi:hypothetical protein